MIGITRYTWNIVGDDGDWSIAERGKNWSIDLPNGEISSQQLLHALLLAYQPEQAWRGRQVANAKGGK